MKATNIFLLLFFALAALQCKKDKEEPKYNGAIEFFVWNSETKKPVPNVNIKIFDCHSSQIVGEQTLIGSGTTGANGTLNFTNIKPMSLSIWADSAGIEPIIMTTACTYTIQDKPRRDTLYFK